jgi:hypothetical protein
MGGGNPTVPLGAGGTPNVNDGTLALTPSPAPGTIGANLPAAAGSGAAAAAATSSAGIDPEIEALNLTGSARKGAYTLKKKHPAVKFTSGRRQKEDQARAMAQNVVKKRSWIGNTYYPTRVSKACQKWVDDNPTKLTQAEIAAGLLSVLNGYSDAQLSGLSKHLSGEAFDVQPVEVDADAIKKTIRGLKGLHRFLEKEDGLIRWHAQFR